MTNQRRQKMEIRAQRHQNNDNEDAAAFSIASDVLRIFVTSVTKSMTTTIANTTVPVAAMPNTIVYSSVIGLYDDESFETKIKEGN